MLSLTDHHEQQIADAYDDDPVRWLCLFIGACCFVAGFAAASAVLSLF